MCETQEIRYGHTMHHPDYEGDQEVGCICAERMEDDYVGPASVRRPCDPLLGARSAG